MLCKSTGWYSVSGSDEGIMAEGLGGEGTGKLYE